MKILKWQVASLFVEAITNSKGTSNEEIYQRLVLRRIAILKKKIFRCWDLSTPMKMRTVEELVFLMTLNGSEY